MAIIEHSFVNGPGDRFVIWSQGCSKKCPQCYQPESWSEKANKLITAADLTQKIIDSNAEGVTLTGGCILEQPEVCLELLELLNNVNLPKGIICFTGYTIEEIEQLPIVQKCLPYIDLLIEGRYVYQLRTYSGLHGSTNQRFIWNELPQRGKSKIDENEVIFDQNIEVHTNDDGIVLTGFPEITKNSRRYLNKLGIYIPIT